MGEKIDLQAGFVGSIVGTAVGDAIGELAFRHATQRTLRRAVRDVPTLVYTDDTAMTIALAESIVESGGLDQDHLGETFTASYKQEPWRGYAPGPPTVLARVERHGIAYPEAAGTLYGGEGSFGNGAAMRVAPVGLFFYDSPSLYEQAQLSAAVTHAHPMGIDGAAIQARAVAEALVRDPGETLDVDDFLGTLLDTARTSEMSEKLRAVRRLIRRRAEPRVAAQELGQGVAVQLSLPFALYCFLIYPRSFRDCLHCAALNGGDRDTLGAMACAVSGAYLGVQAIPRAWREKVENRQHIEDLARELHGMKASRSPEGPGDQ